MGPAGHDRGAGRPASSIRASTVSFEPRLDQRRRAPEREDGGRVDDAWLVAPHGRTAATSGPTASRNCRTRSMAGPLTGYASPDGGRSRSSVPRPTQSRPPRMPESRRPRLRREPARPRRREDRRATAIRELRGDAARDRKQIAEDRRVERRRSCVEEDVSRSPCNGCPSGRLRDRRRLHAPPPACGGERRRPGQGPIGPGASSAKYRRVKAWTSMPRAKHRHVDGGACRRPSPSWIAPVFAVSNEKLPHRIGRQRPNRRM